MVGGSLYGGSGGSANSSKMVGLSGGVANTSGGVSALFGGGPAAPPGGAAPVSGSTIRNLLGGSGQSPGFFGQQGGPPKTPAASTPAAQPSQPQVVQPPPLTPPPQTGQPQLNTATPLTGGIRNEAAPNPVSNEIIDELRNRKKGFGDLDRGIQDIRDRGIAGSKGSQLSRIARGVSGSGVDTYDANKQGAEERNAINRMTTDFALGREKENFNESIGIANLGLSQSGQQLQAQGQAANQAATQQSLGLQAQGQANQLWQAQNALQLQAQQQAQQQANHQWNQQQQQAALQQNAQQANLQVLLNLLS